VGQTDGLKKITLAKDMFCPHSIVSDYPKNAKSPNFSWGLHRAVT